jgi:predicted N-acyltransferase
MPIQTLSRLADLDARQWDALLPDAQPFLRHAFLASLEDSGSVGPHSGWQPAHHLWRSDDGRLLAALPAYVKAHSYGEYVFDWGWADACQRAGPLLPLLLVGMPFSPVSGARLLGEDAALSELLGALRRAAGGRWSGVHVNFTDARADA